MPLLYQKFIKREHLRANPQVLFVFGDNVLRKGMKGQAAEMRGEPNAIGVATKWEPNSEWNAYFHDGDYATIQRIIQQDLQRVHNALLEGKIVVWPADGIGTGLSQLPKKAPKAWALLEDYRLYFETL